jgi:hypothetical protein
MKSRPEPGPDLRSRAVGQLRSRTDVYRALKQIARQWYVDGQLNGTVEVRAGLRLETTTGEEFIVCVMPADTAICTCDRTVHAAH